MQAFGAHHHPSLSGSRGIPVPGPLENVGVIHGDAVQHLSVGENMVPCGFQTSNATASLIVHMRMTVEYFEKLVVLNLLQLVSRNRPAEIGMVDVRDTSCFTYGVDVAL